MPYLFLFLAFTCNAAANIILKLAATSGFSFGGFLRGEWSLAHLYAGVAAALFALNLGFYLVALQKIPLSVGYPVMIGMTFVITTGAALALGERMTVLHAVGLALVFLGVFLIVRATA